MPERVGRYTLRLPSRPALCAYAAVGGKKESESPMRGCFDQLYTDTLCGQDSWEQAESQLQKDALDYTLQKAGLQPHDLDALFAGDLLNQCTGSAFAAVNAVLPFVGLYGACSTMALSLAMASCFVDAGLARRCVAMTSSHFCAAERQFRFPLEYGGQRTPSAQWTATAAGAVLVANDRPGVRAAAVTFGKIKDYGITDINNMGAAMAPAAADTIETYLTDTGAAPSAFDRIYTGDLGAVGSELLCTLLLEKGIDIREQHADCGLLLYDRKAQDVNAGGSGCGCSAAVLCGSILPQLAEGRLSRVLFLATGALLSTTSAQQGLSVPGVAHLVELQADA